VTRLSIGVQSFDDARCSASAACTTPRRRAPRWPRRAAFDTFNIDLMYALPGQTLASCSRPGHGAGLRAAAPVDLPPDGRAQHRLRAEAAGRLPDDDLASDMLDLIGERTAAAGLQRYEVSAFARPGHRCGTT
jgi:coproporphyrinogen III oxidase-like Fe-S oxidoreductase